MDAASSLGMLPLQIDFVEGCSESLVNGNLLLPKLSSQSHLSDCLPTSSLSLDLPTSTFPMQPRQNYNQGGGFGTSIPSLTATLPTWLTSGLLGAAPSSGILPPVSELHPSIRARSRMPLLELPSQQTYDTETRENDSDLLSATKQMSLPSSSSGVELSGDTLSLTDAISALEGAANASNRPRYQVLSVKNEISEKQLLDISSFDDEVLSDSSHLFSATSNDIAVSSDTLVPIDSITPSTLSSDNVLDGLNPIGTLASMYSSVLDHQYTSSLSSLNISNTLSEPSPHSFGDVDDGSLPNSSCVEPLVHHQLSEAITSQSIINPDSTTKESPPLPLREDFSKNKNISQDFVNSLVEEFVCYRCKLCEYTNTRRQQVVQHVQCVHKTVVTSPTHQAAVKTGAITLNAKVVESSQQPVSQGVNKQDKRFLCGKCRKGFSTLNDCCKHLNVAHKAKSNKIRLEWVYASQNPETKSHSTIHKSKTIEHRNEDVTLNLESIAPSESSITPVSVYDARKAQLPEPKPMVGIEDKEKENSADGVQASGQSVPEVKKKKEMSSYQKAWRKKVNKEAETYICEFKSCNVKFKDIKNLEYHCKCHIPGEPYFVCPECSDQCNRWKSMSSHLWRQHVIDMELYACDQCSFRTYSLSKLENLHKRIHLDERPFLCDTCGKCFKLSKQLKNHKVTHTNKKARQDRRMCECIICHRKFTDKRMLRSHIEIVHNKNRPCLCNYCGYSASSQSTLRLHMRLHTGEKPFACDQCDYRTSDHNSLRRHKMVHTGEKPYKCPFCTYACIQSTTYKLHLKKKHPDQNEGIVFFCKMCNFKTVRLDNYKAHVVDHELSYSSPQSVTSSSAQELLDRIKEEGIHPTQPTMVEIIDTSTV